MKRAFLIRLVPSLSLGFALLTIAGCGTSPSSLEEIQKVAHDNQEVAASQQQRMDGQQKQIDELQRRTADQQRKGDNQKKQAEELQRNLADQQQTLANHQKQIDQLQVKASEPQKHPTNSGSTQAPPVDPKKLPTTTEFRQKAVGMSKEELVKWLGKPSSVTDSGESKAFFYDDAARDPDSDKVVGAMVTIENGIVDRVLF